MKSVLSPNDKIGKLPLFFALRFVKQMFSFWGFWIFCFQFVSFANFPNKTTLCFRYLWKFDRFSRRRLWWLSVLASSSLQLHRLCLSSSVSKPDSSVDTHYGSRNRTQRIYQLPNVQGTSEASGVHGHPRALHHMGSLRCWRCHSWLHHCLLHLGIRCWFDCSCCFSLHGCRTNLLQAEKRSAHEERRPRCVYLRLFTKNVIFIECS